jgi:putative N6-adenine-specific DNA methylase
VEQMYAVAAPGLEELVAREIRSLGIDATVEGGGVAFTGGLSELYRTNLHLRTATRVLLRIASFRARTFFELERHARKIEWARFVQNGARVSFRVTSKKSKLYHEGAIAERLANALALTVPDAVIAKASDEDVEGEDAQLFVVRVHRDAFTISADSSGALLHRRGYRQALGKAPLRENLAAAMLVASEWDGARPLVDPMCGAGTIPIEAALLARRIAPGIATAKLAVRDYAFTRWAGYDAALWASLVEDARAAVLPRAAVRIAGYDRDAGAIEAARANAQRAGVSEDVEFGVQPLSALEAAEGPGLLVTNPPYGVRVGEFAPLRDLYATFGKMSRERLPGWRVALLIADPPLESQLRMPLREAFATRNGGIPVRLMVGGETKTE